MRESSPTPVSVCTQLQGAANSFADSRLPERLEVCDGLDRVLWGGESSSTDPQLQPKGEIIAPYEWYLQSTGRRGVSP